MRSWKTYLLALSSVVLLVLIGLESIQKTVGVFHTEYSGSSDANVELVAGSTAGQEFVAEYDGLCSVALVIEGQTEQSGEALNFHLQAAPSRGDPLAVVSLDASEIDSGSYHTFEFPCIRHSAGESFYFYLEAALGIPGPTLSVVGSTEDTYAHGEAVLRGLEGDHAVRDLAFRLGYDPPLPAKTRILLDRITASKPSLWGDKLFYIGLVLAYLTLVYILFLRVTGPDSGEDRSE